MNREYWSQREGYYNKVTFKDGHAYGQTVDPRRNATMNAVQRIRNTDGAVKEWSFGKLGFVVPPSDWKVIAKFFPNIDNPAHPDYKFQLRKFINSPASRPYKVTESKRTNAKHIMVK